MRTRAPETASPAGSATRPPHRDPAALRWFRSPVVQTRFRLLVRLAHMSPAELSHRVAKKVRKRLARTRLMAHDSAGLDTNLAAGSLPEEMRADPCRYLQRAGATRGFVDVGERDERVAWARRNLPEAVSRIETLAAALLSDGIDLLGKRFHPADPDFDWQADPDCGRLWPAQVLDDADAVRRVDADVKFVWEVNRLQFLTILARAHAYTGDDRYGRACVDLVRRWIRDNPHPLGVNWASNLEVAVRSLSLVWSLDFLVGTTVVGEDDARRWLAGLRCHLEHLYAHLSIYTDPTNHLIGEAAALVVLCVRFPEWDPEGRRLRRGLDLLSGELREQVHREGMSREQSTSYQRFVLDFSLQVICICERNRVPIPEQIREITARMLDVAAHFAGASGNTPHIGDSDGARGLPFFGATFWDFRGLLAEGEAVLRRGLEFGLPEDDDGPLWLGGLPQVRQGASGAAIPHRSSGDRRSIVLRDGGYAFLHDPVHTGSRLLFDCGPLGLPPHASHGHADLLSVLVDVGGRPVLVDRGTFAYRDSQDRRGYFRSTRAHNTVEVGGRDQADAFDPFKWLNFPRTRLIRACLEDGPSYVEAEHDGYRRLRRSVTVRRGVLGLAGGWIVIDWLLGMREVGFTRWFHAAPGLSVRALDRRVLVEDGTAGSPLLAIHDVIAPTRPTPRTIDVEQVPHSDAYAMASTAAAVALRETAALPALRVTVLSRLGEDGRDLLRVEPGAPFAGDLHLTDARGNGIDLRLDPQPREGQTALHWSS